MSLDDDLRALADQQYAVLARRQARALGATTPALRHRLRGPDWELVTHRVLRLVGAPRSARQQLMIGVLDAGPGSVVSHRAAAVLWRFPGFSLRTVEVSRPRSARGGEATSVVLHLPRFLPDWHLTERHGIPVTSVARTLFDLAGGIHPARLERLVDSVVARSPSTLQALARMLDELSERGRHGVAAMRSILQDRPKGYVPAASGLERRFERILAEAGEPPLERQVDVGGHEWVGRVDYVDRALRLLFEIDSDLHHTSLVDRAHDACRDERLRAAGWLDVIRLDEHNVWGAPAVVLASVRTARAWARAQLGILAPRIDTPVSILGTRSDARGQVPLPGRTR
ncbi:MAG: hypothetical protein ACRD0N_02125 [Acidimicrobiales bacterium]